MSTLIQVQVQKAGMALMANESVQQFVSACSEGARNYLVSKMKLPKEAYVWARDVFSDSAVFSVDYMEGEGVQKKYVYKTLAVGFTRDKAGAFEFEGLQEVKPVTIYKPIVASGVDGSLKIAKALNPAPDVEMESLLVAKSMFSPSLFKGLV